MYGLFINEELVERATKDRRDGVVFATKFGIVHSQNDVCIRGVCGKPD